LSAGEFALVNPNTGAAPIFRNVRDSEITMRMYRENPVLVRRGAISEALGMAADVKTWPLRYARMFDMTNDSGLFKKAAELKQLGYVPAALARWRKAELEALPLYEGKMVQAFDHRAADIVVNLANLKRAAQQESLSSEEKASPSRYPSPQYWVVRESVPAEQVFDYCLAYKSVTAPSNMRTMIAAMVPACGVGNSMAMLLPEANGSGRYGRWISLLLANLNCYAYDFVLRQKVQGQNLNWFIIEQSCVIAAARFDDPLQAAFAARMRETGLMNGHHPQPTVADFVIPQVLALSYTAHDLAPFARDLDYVDTAGEVLPPIKWDDEDRRARLAALDALFFHLYGLGADDASYILDTFPIVRQQDQVAFGRYRTRDDVLVLLPLLQAAPAGVMKRSPPSKGSVTAPPHLSSVAWDSCAPRSTFRSCPCPRPQTSACASGSRRSKPDNCRAANSCCAWPHWGWRPRWRPHCWAKAPVPRGRRRSRTDPPDAVVAVCCGCCCGRARPS